MNPIISTVEDRVHALLGYGILDTPQEAEFDDIARLAASICQTPIAQINLLDDRLQWSKSQLGILAPKVALENTFCAHTIRRDEVMVVEDAHADTRFCANPYVVGDPHIRFYAGAPLVTPAGVPIGAVCAVDHQRKRITSAQESALRVLARQTMALLESRRKSFQVRSQLGRPSRVKGARQAFRLLESITRIADSALDGKSMLESVLKLVCNEMQWSLGHAWLPDLPSEGQTKTPLEVWLMHHAHQTQAYRGATHGNAKANWSGLLGRAMRGRAAISMPFLLVDHAISDHQFLVQSGVNSGLALPIVGRSVWGAVEFYWTDKTPLDPALLETLSHVGQVLGRALDRQQSQRTLRLSEAYFRHLVEDSLDLITILDAQGAIQFESHSLAAHLDWKPEEIIGRNAFEFVHPDDCAAVLAAFAESIRTEGPTPMLTFRFLHRDGSYRILEGRGNNLLNDPAVNGIVFSSRDITEKKRLEDQFGQLAGGIAHDFNNLMTVITGYSSVAEAHPHADDKLKNAVAKMRRASERVAGLTERLLACASRQILQPRVFNFDAFMSDNESSLRDMLGSNISLHLNLGAKSRLVHADPTQLSLVLRDLTQNARDAMPLGGDVYLETRTLDISNRNDAALHGMPLGSCVLLTIRDTGCGMSSEIRSRIFEPYYTTKPFGKGTGLGLASCQGIIRQSEGRLTVESKLGVGTTLSVYLPVADALMSDLPPSILIDQPLDETPTVLFAEDEDVLRELGVMVLENLGCRVLAAENGRAALKLLDDNPGLKLDLLLTDIMMPEMDGKALAAAIHQRDASTPIIFCSGYAQDPSFHQGLPAEVDFLSKPYTIPALEAQIGRSLQTGSRRFAHQ